VRVAHTILPGKQLVFVTNNSTKSRADYKKKFDKMGITASEVYQTHPLPTNLNQTN
jgi:ribonucleotide monophosphatase NagD (HAD superfamily)